MELTDSQIKSIVGEVMARMQLNTEVSSMHGVFADMNTAIEKAKEAQKTVRMMSMDQREKIISRIRTKIKENAETMARMGVEETGMGNVGDKILKHLHYSQVQPVFLNFFQYNLSLNHLYFKIVTFFKLQF